MSRLTAGSRRYLLVLGAGVGGAAADGPAQELGAVARAVTPGLAPGHVVAGVRATAACQHPQRGRDRAGERLHLVVAQRVRGPGGIDAGPEERLVGEQVAEPGDPGLVHQHRLDGSAARGHLLAEDWETECECVHAESVLVRVELRGSEPARVAQVQRPAVGEPHAEAQPRRVVAVRRVEQWVACGLAVDDDPPAHPEVERERRTAGVRVEQEELAAPARVGEPVTGQCSLGRVGGETALEEPRIRARAPTRPSGRARAPRSAPRAFSASRISGKSPLRRWAEKSEVGDGTLLGALREPGVLGEEATRVQRLGELPFLAPPIELDLVDEEVDRCGSASITMRSPSTTNAIGPPSTASGAT